MPNTFGPLLMKLLIKTTLTLHYNKNERELVRSFLRQSN
jgi:hypothetical protein